MTSCVCFLFKFVSLYGPWGVSQPLVVVSPLISEILLRPLFPASRFGCLVFDVDDLVNEVFSNIISPQNLVKFQLHPSRLLVICLMIYLDASPFIETKDTTG